MICDAGVWLCAKRNIGLQKETPFAAGAAFRRAAEGETIKCDSGLSLSLSLEYGGSYKKRFPMIDLGPTSKACRLRVSEDLALETRLLTFWRFGQPSSSCLVSSVSM